MDSFMGWVGGKKLLRKIIVERIPSHICYVEPFGGAAWVLFYKQRSEVEVYNDINKNLINLFLCVKYHADEVKKELQYFLGSRYLMKEFIEQKGLTDIQKAARFHFLISISFGAMGQHFGTQRKSGGGLRAARAIYYQKSIWLQKGWIK